MSYVIIGCCIMINLSLSYCVAFFDRIIPKSLHTPLPFVTQRFHRKSWRRDRLLLLISSNTRAPSGCGVGYMSL